MFLVNQAMEHISIGTAGIVGLLGYLVVFVGLIFLMIVVMIAGKINVSSRERKTAAAAAPAAAVIPASQAAVPAMAAAPGSAGMLKLFSVSDKDAAILMAIVADKLGKPLNELRFKSIKEV